jgi:hypothetical protein
MLTTAPSATVWPAAVATGESSTTVVASGIARIARVVLVIVPDEFVCGIVSVMATCNWLALATVSDAVADWAPTTVAVRGGQAAVSRVTHAFGSFSTPFWMPYACRRALSSNRCRNASSRSETFVAPPVRVGPRTPHGDERYGRPMSIAPEPAPAPSYTPPPKQRSAVKIVLIVVAAAFVAMALLIGGCFLLVSESTEDAQKVSDQMIAAIQAGDGAQAWSLAGPTFRGVTTEAELTQLAQGLSPLVAKDKVSPSGKLISASTDSGKIAVFVYEMEPASGDGEIWFKTQIRDEGGTWQVLSFRSSESELDTDVE